MTTNYVAYLLAPPRRGGSHLLLANDALVIQETQIAQFGKTLPSFNQVCRFVELGEIRRNRTRWSELDKAISYCLQNNTNLLIAELRDLTNNDAFAEKIIRFIQKINEQNLPIDIACCDQPFVCKTTFEPLVEHSRQKRKLHGELIKAGLSRTTAKSGNPNAAEVISKVNKPKIDNAIIYALMLQPVVAEYQRRGYSQRKMVTALNDEKFTAPEGGQWVLSQLQKVLERLKVNEAALKLEPILQGFKRNNLSHERMAEELNTQNIECPKGSCWNSDCVIKVEERIQQIKDIIASNEFVQVLSPVLNQYNKDELDEHLFRDDLSLLGITLDDITL